MCAAASKVDTKQLLELENNFYASSQNKKHISTPYSLAMERNTREKRKRKNIKHKTYNNCSLYQLLAQLLKFESLLCYYKLALLQFRNCVYKSYCKYVNSNNGIRHIFYSKKPQRPKNRPATYATGLRLMAKPLREICANFFNSQRPATYVTGLF